MGRVLALLRGYGAEWGKAWSAFWYSPQDPTTLGAIRVLTGLMLLYTHAVWGIDLAAFFGPDAWLNADAVRSLQAEDFVFSYLWYVPPAWLGVVHAAALVVLALFTIGLFTRLTSILSFIILVSYVNRVPAALFGLDQINGMLTLYLAIGPSGAAFSVDQLLARYRRVRQSLERDPSTEPELGPIPRVGANLAVRLIQVHMCVIYFFAATSKLQGEAWWDGTAIWLSVANQEYQSADLTWLAHTPLLANLLTHVSIAWELSFCVLVWPRLTRPLALAGAVLMHMGIALFLGMMTFGLVMLIGCVSFVSPALVRRAVALVLGGSPLTVVYDGACGFCRRSAAWIKAADVADQVRLVDFNRVDPASVHAGLTREACLGAMQVVDSRGRVASGYWGFRAIAARLRLFWPVAWLFLIPGAGRVGPRVYRWIADRRVRRDCSSGTCAVHGSGAAVARPSADGDLTRQHLSEPASSADTRS